MPRAERTAHPPEGCHIIRLAEWKSQPQGANPGRCFRGASLDSRFGCVMNPTHMATLQVKGIPAEIRERLEAAATRNFRSLNQEALARIQASFEIEDSRRLAGLNRLVAEGLKGEERPGGIARLRELAAKARR